MMMNVIKWDGREEPFQRRKVEKTLRRIGAPLDVAKKISHQIEDEVYEGITTKEILDLAFTLLEKYKPTVSLRKDLKTALGELRPMPDFEEYVRTVLQAHGYKVTSNKVIQGFCVTHEIDGVAEKDGKTIYLEVKHHAHPHIPTPFEVTLAAKAKWDDIQEGFKKGLNRYSFDKVLIVCNTRLTQHAKKYSECIGLDHLGWNVPAGRGLDTLISEKMLYPVTILKSLTTEEQNTLTDEGIITLKQLVNKPRSLGVPKARWRQLKSEAENILQE